MVIIGPGRAGTNFTTGFLGWNNNWIAELKGSPKKNPSILADLALAKIGIYLGEPFTSAIGSRNYFNLKSL